MSHPSIYNDPKFLNALRRHVRRLLKNSDELNVMQITRDMGVKSQVIRKALYLLVERGELIRKQTTEPGIIGRYELPNFNDEVMEGVDMATKPTATVDDNDDLCAACKADQHCEGAIEGCLCACGNALKFPLSNQPKTAPARENSAAEVAEHWRAHFAKMRKRFY